MTDIPRGAPSILAAIHPVPEYLADPDLKARYQDMKEVLQVPWMGVVTMAYAHYRTFYDVLWQGLRPLCRSRAFVETVRELRAYTESAVAELAPPPIADRLGYAGYAPREIDAIRGIVDVFSHGNFPYVVIATITRFLLEGGEMSKGRQAEPFEGRHAPDVEVPFVLMEAHHADVPTRALYEDIKTVLDLPFVNTDYRALARWPSYFEMAWGDLRAVIGTPAHTAIAQGVHDRALAAARSLPNPGALESRAVRAAAAEDGPLEEVIAVCQLFQWLLPGLVTNVAYFRHQLFAD